MPDATETTPQTDPGQTRFARWTIAVSGAALVAVAVAALTIGGVTAPPPPTGNGGGLGICLAFSMEDLRTRDFAFDGTVTAINGNQATFSVNTGFWGVESGSSVTLQADLMVGTPEVVALEGGPLLSVGNRYLVSGDENVAWSCGYTLVYDEAAAAEWAAAAP